MTLSDNGRPAPSPAFHLLIIAILVAVVYGQTAGFDFLEWDDNGYVRDNAHVLAGLSPASFFWALTSFDMVNWHPLTWWSYLLDISLFGRQPGALHLVNVFFHALNSLLLYLLLIRYGTQAMLALLLAAVFAVHPLHVESVAWIAERKDLLSTFCLLALLLTWDRYLRHGRRYDYALALLFATLGLMGKAMLVTLPCLLMLLDDWPYARLRSPGQAWYRDRLLLARCLEKLPFLALAIGCAWLTLMAQQVGGAVRSLEEVSLLERLMNVPASYAAYLSQTLVPVSQSFIYRFRPPEPLWAIASLALLSLVSWWAAKRGAATRVGWLWFLLSLLPVIGLIKVGDHARADRYMYLPMIGLLLMAVDAKLPGGGFDRLGRTARGLVRGAGLCLVLVLALTAHRYTGYWRDSETLFNRGLWIDPQNHIAHTLLAATYERRRQPHATLSHAEAAMQLAPTSAAAVNAAISASNAALMLGDVARARQYLERSIAAAPTFPKPYYNLGTLFLQQGDPTTALGLFEQAIARGSRTAESYNNYGAALLYLGRQAQAMAAFSTALQLDPGNTQALINLQRSQTLRLP